MYRIRCIRLVLVVALYIHHALPQSLTCDSTTGVCPGAQLTCTCSVTGVALNWNLPGPITIGFAGTDGVGSNETGTNGVFFAIVANDSGGVRESELRYNATESLVNAMIECENPNSADPPSTVSITVTFSDPPSAPGSLSVQSTTYNSATIQWTAPSNNGGSDIQVTGYIITISPLPISGDCSTGSCTVSPDTLMHNITGLDHTIDYNISVAANICDGTIEGLPADDVIVIDGEVPNAPQNVIICNVNDSNIVVQWKCPSYNPLSPPVDNYTVTVNNNDPVTVGDDGSCSYSVSIAVSPQDAPYNVSVVATNNVGSNDTVLIENIMSVQDIITVITKRAHNTLNFTFISDTVDSTTAVTVTLSPNDGMGDGTIGSGVVISGLMSNTLYMYNATFIYNDVKYIIQSTATILVTPTPTSATASTAANPATTDPTNVEALGTTNMIIIIVVVVVVVILILIVAVVIIGICIKVKSGAKRGDDGIALKERDEPEALVERPVPETGQSGPMYQDPNTIERQQAPTGDLYAMPDRSKKSVKRDPPPAASNELATYQDPNTIQHEMAPTGDMYAMPDRKQQQQPAGGRPEDRMYAALDFENGTGTATASTSFQKPRTQEVLYSEVQQPL